MTMGWTLKIRTISGASLLLLLLLLFFLGKKILLLLGLICIHGDVIFYLQVYDSSNQITL